MKHVLTIITMALAALLVPTACGESEYEYSNERCYFVFDNSTHIDATLQSALNQMSPGVFCRVTLGTENGSTYFHFESNQGLKSKQKANAVDMRRSCILGIYNKTGIIVGYANLTSPAILYAYDSQCPNCYYSTNSPSYKLTMTSAGHAVCSRCKREYDMNNGGIVAKGDTGRKMLRYRASCTGALGVLSVVNK